MSARITALGLALIIACTAGADPTLVKTQALGELLMPVEFSAPAIALTLNDSRLSAEITARILNIPVKIGATVQAGDTLVRLDCRDYKQTLARYKAQVEVLEAHQRLATQQLRRARSLRRGKNVSEELLNRREAELTAATAEISAQRATVEMARDNVGKCRIAAPFRAVVLERTGQVGELATPGHPLVRLYDVEHIELSAQVVAEEAETLGDAAWQVFRQGGADYSLRLRVLTPAIDAITRTREARLVFLDRQPLPGSTGRLVWRDSKAAVPATYMVRREGQLGVLLAIQDKAHFQPISGAQEGRPAPTDLSPDVRIITAGRFGLNGGDPIRVVH